MGDVAARLEEVRARMARAAAAAGTDVRGVVLVAVSKGRPPQRILEAVAAGQRVFGENRAQELREKIDCLAPDLEWHFIGHLQRNKVNMVVGKTALIHSVDSRRILEAVAARARELEIAQEVLLQVNVSGEESKYGIDAEETAAMLDSAVRIPAVRVRGLMTIAPLGTADEARRCFRSMRELRDRLARDYPPRSLEVLSMGMTQDFEAALEEGANMVRIGTAIFGA